MTQSGRRVCRGRPVWGYPRDGLLSLLYGSGYIGHQLLQIVWDDARDVQILMSAFGGKADIRSIGLDVRF
jgi:hypothetical protein